MSFNLVPTKHNVLLIELPTQKSIYIIVLSFHSLRVCFCCILTHSRLQMPQPWPRTVEVCALFPRFADSFVVVDLYTLQERALQHGAVC
jgi:hypothetical protein